MAKHFSSHLFEIRLQCSPRNDEFDRFHQFVDTKCGCCLNDASCGKIYFLKDHLIDLSICLVYFKALSIIDQLSVSEQIISTSKKTSSLNFILHKAIFFSFILIR